MAARHKARNRALDILFEAELRGIAPAEVLEARIADGEPPVRDYTVQLVRGVAEHRQEIDARISAALAAGWTLPRLPAVDRAALRIATFELDQAAIPPEVAISEAVSLVTELSTEDSGPFVNGVLATLATSRRTEAVRASD